MESHTWEYHRWFYIKDAPPVLTEKPGWDSRKQPEDVLSERLWPEDKDVVNR
jgi:hypothetical protein